MVRTELTSGVRPCSSFPYFWWFSFIIYHVSNHILGSNYWIHDIEVTNRDECVTVKSPASNILVERIWCNQSGGSAIGSLGTGTAIENILYRNVYTNGGNQIFMIKSNGGSGYVRNVLFQNFIARGTAYGLDIDQYWSSESTQSGSGVQLSNITFQVSTTPLHTSST